MELSRLMRTRAREGQNPQQGWQPGASFAGNSVKGWPGDGGDQQVPFGRGWQGKDRHHQDGIHRLLGRMLVGRISIVDCYAPPPSDHSTALFTTVQGLPVAWRIKSKPLILSSRGTSQFGLNLPFWASCPNCTKRILCSPHTMLHPTSSAACPPPDPELVSINPISSRTLPQTWPFIVAGISSSTSLNN